MLMLICHIVDIDIIFYYYDVDVDIDIIFYYYDVDLPHC